MPVNISTKRVIILCITMCTVFGSIVGPLAIGKEASTYFRESINEYVPTFRVCTRAGLFVTDVHVSDGLWTFAFIRDRDVCNSCEKMIIDLSKKAQGILVAVVSNYFEAEKVMNWAPVGMHIIVDDNRPYLNKLLGIEVALHLL